MVKAPLIIIQIIVQTIMEKDKLTQIILPQIITIQQDNIVLLMVMLLL